VTDNRNFARVPSEPVSIEFGQISAGAKKENGIQDKTLEKALPWLILLQLVSFGFHYSLITLGGIDNWTN